MKHALIRSLYAALLIALMLAALGPVRPAYAATYTVNSLADNAIVGGNLCTLREAIMAANNATGYKSNSGCGPASSADDTITFSVSGTIVLGSTLPNIVSGQGRLTISGPTRGGAITISGDNTYQVMVVNNGANLTLQNLTITEGNAGTNFGGGVLNSGTLTVTNSTFSGNSAKYGAGVYSAGTLTITNSTFYSNIALMGYGGGVRNSGTLTIINSAFIQNAANGGYGGGVYNAYPGGTVIANSTFSGNTATNGYGGGVYNATNATLSSINSTFANNSAYGGGGVYNNSGVTYMENTILANNGSGGNCSGGIINVGNNIDDGTTCGWGAVAGSMSNTNPQLGALTGSPAYFPLNSGSPAIDAGNDATCATAPVNNQSQNGVTRPQDGDGNGTATCDIGSYEAPAAPTPTPTTTPTATPTATASNTPTATPANTPTATPTSCTTKPAKPTLVAPANGATVTQTKVTLQWNDVACETQYKVRVKNAATNGTAFKKTLSADVTQVKTTALPRGQTYKWFVKACNGFGCAKSVTRRFTVQ